MLLNLTIIKDALTDFTPIQQQTDRMTPRRLESIQFLPKDGHFDEHILYFCNAEELPPAQISPIRLL